MRQFGLELLRDDEEIRPKSCAPSVLHLVFPPLADLGDLRWDGRVRELEIQAAHGVCRQLASVLYSHTRNSVNKGISNVSKVKIPTTQLRTLVSIFFLFLVFRDNRFVRKGLFFLFLLVAGSLALRILSLIFVL